MSGSGRRRGGRNGEIGMVRRERGRQGNGEPWRRVIQGWKNGGDGGG